MFKQYVYNILVMSHENNFKGEIKDPYKKATLVIKKNASFLIKVPQYVILFNS